MWSNEELKGRAIECLRKYYRQAWLVSLVCLFLGCEGGLGGTSGQSVQWLKRSDVSPVVIYQILMLLIFLGILFVIFAIFVGSVIQVGHRRYYMESRAIGEGAGIGRIFWGFKSGHFFNIVSIIFLMNVKVILWSLLLLIPGIVKSYEYAMIPYILSENPDISSQEAFALSKEMMDGNKFNYFLLGLSFIGWSILSILLSIFIGGVAMLMAGPVGMVVVMILILSILSPYVDATMAEFYGVVRRPYIGKSLAGYGVELTEDYVEETEEKAEDYWSNINR